MKKGLLLLLVTFMCVSLCACGGSEGTSGGLFQTEKEVEITMDNWQEYFEEREIISARLNAFDEWEQIAIHQIIALKDEYEIDEEKSEVAIEYTVHSETYYVDVDTDTWKYTYGDRFEDNREPYSFSTMASFGECVYNIGDNNRQTVYGVDYSGKGDFYTGIDKETQKRVTEKYFIDEITRIKGTLYIVEE